MTRTEILEWDRKRTACIMTADGAGCPQPSPRFREALERYALDGVPTGGFLKACLENDLCGAVCRADPEAFLELPAIIRWIYSTLPANSWGTKQYVADHLERKREYLAKAAEEWMGVKPE